MAMQAWCRTCSLRHIIFSRTIYLFPAVDRRQRNTQLYGLPQETISKCEERHGTTAVEAILDSAHALMEQGVFRYRRPPRLSTEKRAGADAREAGI